MLRMQIWLRTGAGALVPGRRNPCTASSQQPATTVTTNHKSTNRPKPQEANVRRKAADAARKAAAEAEALRAQGKLPPGQKQWWEKDVDAAPGDDEEEDGEGGDGGSGDGQEDGGARKKRKRTAAEDDEDDDKEYFRWEGGVAGGWVPYTVRQRVAVSGGGRE